MARATDALFRRALDHHLAGRIQEASQAYQQVLAREPRHAPSLHLLGTIALQVGRPDVAASLIEAAITSDGRVAAFHNDLGEVYRQLGRPTEAEARFRRALALNPALGSAHNNLGILLQGQGRLAEAAAAYRRAAEAMPDLAEPRTNLGAALLELGDLEGARAAAEAARRLAPEDAGVALNLGNVRLAQNRPAEAEALYREALERQPGYAMAEVNLGRALRALGRPQEALALYARAVARAPDLAVARWNEGLCRLLLGDLKGGWPGFAWRWRAGAVPPHGLAAPEWQGGPLAGTRLLVHAEQGLGDTIQFVRFLPRLRALAPAALALLVQTPLARLLAGMAEICTAEAPLPPHDLRVPLLDVPRHLGITLDDLPGPMPYLAAEPALAERWADRLAGPPGRKVGIVRRGRPEHANDINRSLPAGALAPLGTVDGLAWFGLAKEPDAELAGVLPDLVELAPLLADMAETAAAICGLDLVITVDTAVAHLAGALGKAVWILLPFAPDWRWLLERTDTPWYPSARLFRQRAAGEWDAVIAEVAAALSAWAGAD